MNIPKVGLAMMTDEIFKAYEVSYSTVASDPLKGVK